MAGAIAGRFAHPQPAHPLRAVLANGVISVAAIQSAGFAHESLGGTLGHFTWPWQAVPIGAAVVGYCFVKGASADVIAPLVARQPVNRSWPTRVLHACPTYSSARASRSALVEMIDHRAWEVLAVAALPLYFAYRAYCDYVRRLEDEHHRAQVIDSLNEGMCVVDSKAT